MKRGIQNEEEILKNIDMAKRLMFLSRSFQKGQNPKPVRPNDVFECKTCNRKFSSFQALGGHRASHKRQKLSTDQHKTIDGNDNHDHDHDNKFMINGDLNFSKRKTSTKMHECSICGQEFTMGQALGGHMRRHRATILAEHNSISVFPSIVSKSMPVLKRSNSSKRVMCLDLNLTPLENDLEFIFGKNLAPKIDPRYLII